MASCANCGATLAGGYCHACGPRAIDDDELTVGHALKVGADEILHLESRTLRTMARLFVPGAHVVFELHYISFLYLIMVALGLALRPFPTHPLVSMLST